MTNSTSRSITAFEYILTSPLSGRTIVYIEQSLNQILYIGICLDNQGFPWPPWTEIPTESQGHLCLFLVHKSLAPASLKIVLPGSTFLENGREYSLFEIFNLIGAWVFFYFVRIRHLDTSVWNDIPFRLYLGLYLVPIKNYGLLDMPWFRILA